MTTAVALAVHIFGAVIWVGGMFAIYVCLCPALGTLDPPQRLRLMWVTFQKFFLWVWVAILLLLASGYWIVFMRFGGFAGAGLHIHLMQMIGSTGRGYRSNAPSTRRIGRARPPASAVSAR